MKTWHWFSMLGIAMLVALWPARANADQSDQLNLTVGTGALTTFTITEAAEASGTTVPTFTIPATATTGTITVDLLDPGTLPPTISDRLTLTIDTAEAGTQSVHIGYASDTEGVLPPAGTLEQIPETGNLINVTGMIFPGVATPAFTLSVQSDLDAVPEPGTLALVGMGLTGLAAWRRRRNAM